jgi:hypothetical protein
LLTFWSRTLLRKAYGRLSGGLIKLAKCSLFSNPCTRHHFGHWTCQSDSNILQSYRDERKSNENPLLLVRAGACLGFCAESGLQPEHQLTFRGNRLMKLSLTVLITAIVAESAFADSARLLLITPQTDIKPQQKSTLEVFLYNPNSKPVRVPSLEDYSIVSSTQGMTGRSTSGGGTQIGAFDVMLPPQMLGPKSIQHKTIQVKSNVRAGDFAEIYVELGRERTLRSNAILLFCRKTN